MDGLVGVESLSAAASVSIKLLIFDKMTKDKKYIIERISESVRQIDPNAKVYLFGSRARGDETPDSDWDILILTEYAVSIKDEQRFRHKLIPLELELGEAFSTFVYYQKDWITRHRITPFYQNVTKEGIKI